MSFFCRARLIDSGVAGWDESLAGAVPSADESAREERAVGGGGFPSRSRDVGTTGVCDSSRGAVGSSAGKGCVCD